MNTHAHSGRQRADPEAERRDVAVPTPAAEAGSFAPVPVAGLVGGLDGGLVGTAPVSAEVHRRRADGDILGGTEVPVSTRAVLTRRRGRGSPLPQGVARRRRRDSVCRWATCGCTPTVNPGS